MNAIVRGLKFEGFLVGGWRAEGVEMCNVIHGFTVDEGAIGVGGGREVALGETRVRDQRWGLRANASERDQGFGGKTRQDVEDDFFREVEDGR
ncbi:hypothetical protein Hanom_Chr08g00737021 [Helianthus anomalus]